MKLTEFIEYYKEKEVEKIESVSFTKTLTLSQKIELMARTDNMFLKAGLNFDDPYSVVKAKELARFFVLLLGYFDLEVESQDEEIYDECHAIGLNLFLEKIINKNDFEILCRMFETSFAMNDAYLLRSVLQEVGKASLSEDLTSTMNIIKNNSDVLANVNEIIGYNSGNRKTRRAKK